jgi:TonB family protein
LGAIIRLTGSFFLSVLIHLFLIGGAVWVRERMMQPVIRTEPQVRMLDLTRLSHVHISAPRPAVRTDVGRTDSGPLSSAPSPTHSSATPTRSAKHTATRPSPPTDRSTGVAPYPQIPVPRTASEPPVKSPASLLPASVAAPHGSVPDTPAEASRKPFRPDPPLIREIRRLTNRTLHRIAPPRLHTRRHGQRTVTLRFVLRPNGSITDLRILKSSGLRTLDRHARRAIRTAQKHYPHPERPTAIRLNLPYRF